MDSVESVKSDKDEVSEETTKGTSPIPVPDASPGINGDKEMDVDDTSSEDNKDINVEDDKKGEDEKDIDMSQTEKRKYDDMKDSDQSEDSSTNEFLGFADAVTEEDTPKPSEEKKDKQEKSIIKSDLLAFDSAFGKGKRSRIPNKKYEGLTLKSFAKTLAKSDHLESDSGPEVTSSEDGRNDDDIDSHKLDDTSEVLNSTHSVSARSKSNRLSSASSSGPQVKKQKTTHDMSNPAYLKPFEHGWKRELVYRAVPDQNSLRRNGDIYYITPTGKKVRSMREVSENLNNKELSLEDFTFFKEPIGLNDPEKEIIRDAKLKGSSHTANLSKKITPKTRAAKEKSMSASKMTSSSTPETPSSTKAGKSPRLGGFKVKFPGSTRLSQSPQKNSKRLSSDNQMEVSMLPPSWTSKRLSKQSWQSKTGSLSEPTLEQKACNPCSIRCQGVSGLIPTLQCRLCLCLYHNECVGLGGHEKNIPGYVCKNCQMDKQQSVQTTSTETALSIGPPPLTPISSLIANNSQLTTPPILQRIPRPGETPYIPNPVVHLPPRTLNPPKLPDPSKTQTTKFSTPSRYIKMSDPNSVMQPESNKSILGAVTTWFPPSSTIQMNASNCHDKNLNDGISAPRPQSLVIMGERKFVLVPKTNVLSVSPALGAAASTPSSVRITSPTADKAPIFDAKERLNNKQTDSPVPNTPATASLGPSQSASTDESPSVTFIPAVDKSKLSAISDKSLVSTPSASPTASKQAHQDDSVRNAPTKLFKETPTEPVSTKTRRSLNRKAITTPTPTPKVNIESKFMQYYLQNLSYGYQTLLHVFQYLKVQDLLRAGCVCTMWRDITAHPSLWRTVRMKNSQVSNWEGLADALNKHRTETLDLRKILLPSNGDDMWPLFSKAIGRVDTLLRIELCRCPAGVIEELAKSNPNLQVVNAITIRCDTLDLSSVDKLINLQELRLKSTNGFVLKSDLTPLRELTQLKCLSLTSVKELNKQNIEVIGDLVNLESLDLGECSDFPDSFGVDVISKLTKLEKLRLEKGQGSCGTFNILEAISQISSLQQLELVNFDVKAGFDKALGTCTNIKKLLIIPTYISQSATTNHMVLGGVIKLKATLSHFIWGVTLELLRVTELFVDQCEDSPSKEKKKPTGNGDSIPVLKPVPIMKAAEEVKDDAPSKEPPQVEILPLPTLQKLLLNCLPTTRVKILKIPFHATWRQNISDTVN